MHTEQSLLDACHRLTSERHTHESRVVLRLQELICECIEGNSSIKGRSLIATDSIALQPPPHSPSPPSPHLQLRYQTFLERDQPFDDRLNREQERIFHRWVQGLSLGGVVLEQDLRGMWVKCTSLVGPFGTSRYTTNKLPSMSSSMLLLLHSQAQAVSEGSSTGGGGGGGVEVENNEKDSTVGILVPEKIEIEALP